MLTKSESAVMEAVYTLCGSRQVCLVSPWEILNLLPSKSKITEERLDKILNALQMDEYFEMISSDRKGEKMYVITLRPLGVAFKRSSVQNKRAIVYKIILSVGGAVLAFVAGAILRALFHVN